MEQLLKVDRPFIRLKHRHGPVVDALAGQKFYRLSPKLRAFPTPEVIWLKDGMLAPESCSRYHVEGNSLLIRDVAEEDAGVYTVLVGIQQYGLYRNLTVSLVVNVKPQIGEKAVSLQDPGIYPPWEQTGPALHIPGVPSTQNTLTLASLSTEGLSLLTSCTHPTHVLLSP
ncbi:hypothetical protein SKAU_G00059960 [Synaphobranchus kaupii]|uniref:Ig-like domain-containing protein n=1 Tax=Synaphobranchus kaupii TaxID=118154 RepID=A0A9Q1G564_SYNKA|nr:hypothetical protein SKAU_G00059960 [Synaphobranchus kaupii]